MSELSARAGMNRKRLFAFLAFIAFAGFLGILIWFVPRLDLGIALCIGIALAAYDIWDQLWRRGAPGH